MRLAFYKAVDDCDHLTKDVYTVVADYLYPTWEVRYDEKSSNEYCTNGKHIIVNNVKFNYIEVSPYLRTTCNLFTMMNNNILTISHNNSFRIIKKDIRLNTINTYSFDKLISGIATYGNILYVEFLFSIVKYIANDKIIEVIAINTTARLRLVHGLYVICSIVDNIYIYSMDLELLHVMKCKKYINNVYVYDASKILVKYENNTTEIISLLID